MLRFYKTIFLEPLVLPKIPEDYFIVDSIDYELIPEQDGFLDLIPLVNKNIISPYDEYNQAQKKDYRETNKWFVTNNIFGISGHVSVSQMIQLLKYSRIYIENIDQEIDQELLQKKILKIEENKTFQHETP